MSRFTLTRFTLSDMLDLSLNQFDQYVIEECQHFLRDNKAYQQTMRDIQTYSALIFYVLLHAMLSRYSSLWCILSSLVPMVLSKDTKGLLYTTVYQLVYPS